MRRRRGGEWRGRGRWKRRRKRRAGKRGEGGGEGGQRAGRQVANANLSGAGVFLAGVTTPLTVPPLANHLQLCLKTCKHQFEHSIREGL